MVFLGESDENDFLLMDFIKPLITLRKFDAVEVYIGTEMSFRRLEMSFRWLEISFRRLEMNFRRLELSFRRKFKIFCHRLKGL